MLFLHNPGASGPELQQRFAALQTRMQTEKPINNNHAREILSLLRELPPEEAQSMTQQILSNGCEAAKTYLKQDPLPDVPDIVIDFFRAAFTLCVDGYEAVSVRASSGAHHERSAP